MVKRVTPEILISPLDWGLGHASRCIPIICEFLSNGANVTIAASGRSLNYLKKEFPDLQFINLPGFSPTYSSSGKMLLKMTTLIPQFFYYLISENYQISKIIKLRKFDLIISDNRYGVFNKKVKSVIIIHQIRIRAPKRLTWIEPVLFSINKFLLRPFKEVWIPDNPSVENLSGDLSHNIPVPLSAVYIGPLSRFVFPSVANIIKEPGDYILILLSGQEPQRTILEKSILQQAHTVPENFILVQGIPEVTGVKKDGNIKILSHVLTQEAESLILNSKLIICRPGYSTIMDLAILGAKAMFVATPGQTEQEYLAEYYHNSGIALSVKQEEIDLRTQIPLAFQFTGFQKRQKSVLMTEKIQKILLTIS
jgi:uncharacterized protein (TIGR00661 family)